VENISALRKEVTVPEKMGPVMIVAGEASSDDHAASVASALLQAKPDICLFGMGGSSLRSVGVETVVDSEKCASVMGITEVFGSLKKIIQAFKTLLKEADLRKPELVVLVDFPDFNLRLAKRLHKRGIKVLYFVSPQIWAWREYRIKHIKKYVDFVAPIFPFEETFYHKHQVPAEFVGHPFLDKAPIKIVRDEFLKKCGLDPNRPVIAFLPGSRKSELRLLAPQMNEAIKLVQLTRPGVQALVPIARTLDAAWVRKFFSGTKDVSFVNEESRTVCSVADLGVIASGTAAIEAALEGLPMVLVYKFSPFTYLIGKLLIKGIKNFGMPNLISGKVIVPELLQDEVTPENIKRELENYFGSSSLVIETKRNLCLMKEKLQGSGDKSQTAAARTAQIAFGLIRGKVS